MALSALACLGSCLLVWASLGPAAKPWWPLFLAAPLAWLAGLALRRTACFTAGMYLMTGLAGMAAVVGTTAAGLAAMGLLLVGWDLGWLELAPAHSRHGGAPLARAGAGRPLRAAAVTAMGTAAAAAALALGLSRVRPAISFWTLLAGGLLAWAGVVLLILTVRRVADPPAD